MKERITVTIDKELLEWIDKRIKDKLIVQKSANKIYEIDAHIITSIAGIISDARVLIERSQVLAQQHRITYDSAIEPELIIKEISNIQQQFTQYGGARPFGCVASWIFSMWCLHQLSHR